MLFIDPLYIHIILGQSHFKTGLIFFTIPMVVVFGSYIIGYLNHLFGSKKLLMAGAIACLLSSIGHMILKSQMNYWIMIPTFLLLGIGWAIGNTVPATFVGKSVNSDHVGVAVGAMFTFWNISASVFLAIAVTVFHTRATASILTQFAQNNLKIDTVQQKLLELFVAQPDKLQSTVNQFGRSQNLIIDIFKDGFMSGQHMMYLLPLIFSVISLIAIMFFLQKKDS